jgi:hypothetical protein
MSALQRRLAALTDTRANLIAQLRELNRLRDRVRVAHLATRRVRRIEHREIEHRERGRMMPATDML